MCGRLTAPAAEAPLIGPARLPAVEYARRVADTKARMAQAGLDVILCQDPANICWLTGFDGRSFHVPQCVLVHVAEERPSGRRRRESEA